MNIIGFTKVFSHFLNDIKRIFADCIFPLHCLGCDKEGEWLCDICLKKIDLSGIFCCPVCHKDNKFGKKCQDCQERSFLNSHVAITQYHDSWLIGSIIQNFKYNFVVDLSLVIEKMINGFLQNNQEYFADINYIVPVPLHKKRIVERGFNQAEIVAEILSKKLNLPLVLLLNRHKNTPHQAKLAREKRLVNVKEAFSIIPPYALWSFGGVKPSYTFWSFGGVKQKKILLVDDVFTTGSTMQECTKVLLNAGAKEVRGFSLARG